MEKRQKIEAVNGEFLLPEAIIQHIQSFLSGKEAAQTAILSKSWYSAWSTRPNLDFNQRDFQNRGDGDSKSQIVHGFSEFTKKTMQRYQELNLKIEKFRLCMETTESDSCSLANELIVKAMELGATDLNFEFPSRTRTFVSPDEVLGSKNLVRLSLVGCKIDRGEDGKVNCSRLKSLSLRSVDTEGDMIRDIISSCPLIEKLFLSNCTSVLRAPSSNVVTRKITTMLRLSPFIVSARRHVGSVVDGPIHLYEFCKLKCLLLEKVEVDALFTCDFSSKFPSLKDLTLLHCRCCKRLQISSHSLECISIVWMRLLSRAIFAVPSIHKFTFSGSILPFLSIETTSSEWESDISITRSHPTTSWLIKLQRFLKNLSLSKISLSLNTGCFMGKSFNHAGYSQGKAKPVVENLMLSVYDPCAVVLDGLFWCFRPKFITLYWSPKSCIGLAGRKNSDLVELLCKTLVQEVSERCCIPNRNAFALHDLEEVNVEIFEESLVEWRPVPWKTLLVASSSPEDKRKIRFQLRWG